MAPTSYTITYVPNGGTISGSTPSSYTSETSTFSLPTPTLGGYTFVGWYTSSNFSGGAVTQITKGSTGNKTFYAKWVPVEYGITYNLNGGTNASANPSNYNVESETITLANPTRSGYSFAGWYTSSSFSGSSVTQITKGSIGNKTFYAKWVPVEYGITYNLNGGTNASANPSNYNVESGEITLASPTRSGYTFAGWYDNENFTGDAVTAIAVGTIGNKIFYAGWAVNINYVLNGKDDVDNSANPLTYIEGIGAVLVAPTRDGYIFVGWYDNENFTGDAVAEIAADETGAKTFYAKWVPVEYGITYNLNGGTNASANPSNYNVESETITLANPTRSGYSFAGWYDNENFTGDAVTVIAAGTIGEKTFYAKWKRFIVPTPKASFHMDDRGCYEIATAEDLYGFAAIVNGGENEACGVLTADIEVNKNVLNADGSLNGDVSNFMAWTPIGSSNKSFAGSFDGQNHKIIGLYFDDSNKDDVGLFGYVRNRAGKTVTISNVGVVDSYLHCSRYVGGLVGYAYSALTVSSSYSTSTVTGRDDVGGLVGRAESTLTVSNSYNQGHVRATISIGFAGGFASHVGSSSTITNSYNVGTVQADRKGDFVYSGNLTIVNSFYIGSSTFYIGSSNKGGTKASEEQFKNGIVALALNLFDDGGVNGAVWGQNVGVDDYPNFSGKVENFSASVSTITFHTYDGNFFEKRYVEGLEFYLPMSVERVGFAFKSWYDNAAFTGNSKTMVSATASGDLDFYAWWVPVEYDITYNLNGGVNSELNPSNYNVESETITLANPTRSGYTFAGWYDNENFTGDAVTAIAAGTIGNKTFYAKWVPVEYGITYNLNGGVNSELNPLSYNIESATITLADPTRSGYSFAGWYDNESFTGDAVTKIAAGTIGEKTFYAKWIQTVFGAITIAADRSSAIIDGNSSAATDLPAPIVVNKVVMKRNFNAMVPSTIVLPFDFAYDEDNADRVNARFYRIGQVYRHESAWKVDMIRTYDLHAGTPYSVIVEDTKLNFDFNGEPVTIKTPEENLVQGSTNITGEKVVGDWSFVGTYTYKAWGEDDYKEPFYGYATKKDALGNIIRDENGIGKGVFGSIVSGNYILPMRAYLERHVFLENGPKRAPSLFKTSAVNDDVPESLEISFIDGDGQTTAIGHFNTITGEFKVDRWFDMKGRKLDHKPTTKGIYFNNNKRVIIK